MPIRVILAALALTFAITALAAPSQYRYRWTDASGLQHYSDSLTADAIKNGYDIINENGVVLQHVERTLTPQERKAREAAEKKAAAARRAQREQALADQQMLAAYPTEQAYRTIQQALVDELTGHIKTETANLKSQEQNLSELLDKAAEAERDKKPIPPYLTDRIAKQRAEVDKQRKVVQRKQADKSAAERRMQANMQHYRDLRAAQEASLQGGD